MKKTLMALGMLSAFAAMPVLAHDMDDTSTPPMHGDMADHMIKKMDTNGDGKISREEHAAFADKMFTAADTNKDGQLTKDEINAYHAKQRAGMSNKHVHTTPNDSKENPHPTKDRTDQDM